MIDAPSHQQTFRRRFLADRSGAVAILFGLAAIPLMGMVGVGLDYAGGIRQRTRLVNALDAAVLTAASSPATPGSIQPTVTSYVRANLGSISPRQTLIVTASKAADGSISASATLTSPTWIMGLFGKPNLPVSANVKAAPAGANEKIEVALALDTTGSMMGAKLAGLKVAAKDLVTKVYSGSLAAANVRVGIVPFSTYVNVGVTYRGASWLTNTAYSSTTTTVCSDTYPNAQYLDPVTTTGTCYNDGVPYSCTSTTYNTIILGTPVNVCAPVTSTSDWYGCVGSRSAALEQQELVDATNPSPGIQNCSIDPALLRLTNDQSALNARIDALVAANETYIAPGILWAWRVLSPLGPFADGAAYGAAKKYLVLMTDGANTRSVDQPYHWNTDATSANTVTSQTCASVKAKGIRVYTVAFDVTDAAIKNILQACATSPTDYYDSATVADLQTAFGTIAASISGAKVRLVH